MTQPTKGQKDITDHFRGISDFGDKGFSRSGLGLIDTPRGGKLCRIGGCISATSEGRPSIWSIAQLRFQQAQFLVVHSTGRELYDPGYPYKGGEIDDWNPPPPPVDEDGGIPNGPPPPPPPMNGPNPDPDITCYSWWSWRYGTWWYPVTDLKICQRHRGNTYSASSSGANSPTEAVQGAYTHAKAVYIIDWISNPAWGVWGLFNAGAGGLLGPYLRISARWRQTGAAPDKYSAQCNITWREVQHKPTSNTLAGVTPPPLCPCGAPFSKAYYSAGGGVGAIEIDTIGQACQASPLVATGCADVCTPLVYMQAPPEIIGIISYSIPGNANPWAWSPYTYLFDYYPPYDHGRDELWLTCEGGTFDIHESHFEGGS